MTVFSCLLIGAAALFAETLPPLPDGAFTLAVIPDTQRYEGEGKRVKKGPPAKGPTRNATFDACVDWIAAHVASERIFFVSHTGDIVDNRNDAQFAFAARAMSRLDGKVPYAIAPGNHDIGPGDCDLFVRHFPAAKFADNGWYAGNFGGYTNRLGKAVCRDNADSCQLVEAGGVKFVFLHVECNAPDPVLRWADAMLERHAGRKAVIVTHQDLGFLERRFQDEWNRGKPDRAKAEKAGAAREHPDRGRLGRLRWKKCHGDEGNTPEQAWTKCYSRHPNVIMILSGDQGPANLARLTSYGEKGNRVHGIMHDTQTHGLRLYRFRPAEKTVEAWTVDPKDGELLNAYNGWSDRADFQFRLDVDF